MSIRTMTSGDDYDYTLEYNDETIKMKESYKGCVLSTYERNMYDDSDFLAVVWNGTSLEHVEYATTRGWTYLNSAIVDATEETLNQVREYLTAIYTQQMIDLAVKQSKQIEKGRIVRVVKGRKIAIGTTGTVVTICKNVYDEKNPKVMVKIGNGIQTTYANNLEVVNPVVEMDMAYILEEAAAKANRTINARNYR